MSSTQSIADDRPVDRTGRGRAGEGRSFLRIALGRFFRNRLAVGALVVVWLLATVAVFVPFLANDKPYTIVTTLPDRYDNSFFVVLSAGEWLAEQAGQREPAAVDEAKQRENIAQMRWHLKQMRRQLPAPKQAALDELAAAIEEQVRRPDAERLTALLRDFEEQFDLTAVQLVARRYWPLLRSLSAVEIFFIAFYAVFMVWAGWCAVRRRTPRPLRAMLIMVALGGLAAGLWRLLCPPFNDPTDYKKLVRENPAVRAVFPPVPYGENENITLDARAAPWWLLSSEERAALSGPHWLGTDTNGRDVLCRMIFGARIAMSIGLVAVGIYIAIGIVMGALAGYYRGWIDMAISRLIEVVICFPSFFLIIAVLAFLRPSIFNIMVVIGLTGWTGVARLVRGEFLRVVNEEYVMAIRALGGADARIIFRHVLPNGMGPVLVSASFGLAAAILAESALSFLGFGVPQPNASWGTILYDGRNDIAGTWWLTVFPGLAIFITVTALNLVGEGVRDATDPRFFAD
ncbi:MAG: hypothetical protein Kow0059_12310 [Candidatus Sumerlaeia bacterium]